MCSDPLEVTYLHDGGIVQTSLALGGVVPRVGELVLFRSYDQPFRVSEVLHDLQRGTVDVTVALP